MDEEIANLKKDILDNLKEIQKLDKFRKEKAFLIANNETLLKILEYLEPTSQDPSQSES